jgi:uncharacterized membrane protein
MRWFHLTTGIAWIGASFYFNWLENTLNRDPGQKPGIAGNLWAIHGGGFYYLEKYKNAPEVIPNDLHWFKWEAYFTWLSGVALLIIVFYCNLDLLLAPESVARLDRTQSVLVGLASPFLAWFCYDFLCKTRLGRAGVLFSIVGICILALSAFGLDQIFSSRGSFMHIGAMIGTIMVGNVFRVIIPSQKAMVAAAHLGKEPDPQLGRQALQRSRHNNYLTLPVLFIMISNHYPATYMHHYPWAILTGIIAVGMITRHYFNIRKKSPRAVIYIYGACMGTISLIFATKSNSVEPVPSASTVSFSTIQEIIYKRCIQCHSSTPTDETFTIAPLGVTFDTQDQIKANVAAIRYRAIDLKDMPFNNKTGMTAEERSQLRLWIDAGAKH